MRSPLFPGSSLLSSHPKWSSPVLPRSIPAFSYATGAWEGVGCFCLHQTTGWTCGSSWDESELPVAALVRWWPPCPALPWQHSALAGKSKMLSGLCRVGTEVAGSCQDLAGWRGEEFGPKLSKSFVGFAEDCGFCKVKISAHPGSVPFPSWRDGCSSPRAAFLWWDRWVVSPSSKAHPSLLL